jgi:hypothetical protein
VHTWWPSPREPEWIRTVLAQAERLRHVRVGNAVDLLDLAEVIARPHRAELVMAAQTGALGDRLRVCAREAAGGLGVREVVFAADADAQQGARPVAQDGVELGSVERQRPPSPCTRRDLPRDLVHQRLDARPALIGAQRQREQPNTAVDVVADSARRDHPVRRLGRRDPADREPVPLVDVGHRQRGIDDAGQRRHVAQLLERAVVADLAQQLGVGEHPRRDTHARDRPRGQLPQRVVDAPRLKHRASAGCGDG